MVCKEGQQVFPGDVLSGLKSNKLVSILGPGLHRNDDLPNSVIVTKVGTLGFKAPNTYWVESNEKRYSPKRGDLVVGVVIKKSGDMLKVDIGASEHASLSMLSFEGATKKQKVDVNVGDAVYARVHNAYKEMEPELMCVDALFKAGKLGLLSNEGFVFNTSVKMAQKLLDLEYPLLWTLGKKYSFEIAVGLNGKIWLKCNRTLDTLKIQQAIHIAERQSNKSIVETCRKIR
ncbi:exosome complex component RRP40 [Coccinella septempunctata]|uniref:exosome complex component RRP40 n=1 Tax=Coccinella septempunctata TaxID=41139 RepID=UPI001D064CE0|nr:exosome complex component RRP40 [Coccinella septempunctata]